MSATVKAVSKSTSHNFSKPNVESIHLIAGQGVEGDAHMGKKTEENCEEAKPNLRQVSLIQNELYEELRNGGFDVYPGQLAENITTEGIDLLSLPRNTRLHIGETAVVELTILRNPCNLIDNFKPGLKAAVLSRDADGKLIRRAGALGMILVDGIVRPGDPIRVELPPEPHHPLDVVYREF